jgi:Zn-dependent M28 family amino/carboxypeptidase
MTRQQRAVAAMAVAGAVAAVCAQAPAKFDGGRAYEHLRQIVGMGPRPAGSDALEATRRYIAQQLSASGVKVSEQAFSADTPLGAVRMVNVIGAIPGKRADRIVIGGHYDTKLFRQFRFVGANDGGSSAALLIELARVLKARANPLSVEVVFFDGEESMLPDWGPGDNTYGSRHYVDAAKSAGKLGELRAFILVDMIGDRDLDVAREGMSTTWLTDLIWASARRLGYERYFLATVEPIGGDDHFPFLEAGLPAVDIIDFHYPPWHTAADTLDKVSARSLQVVGDVLIDALPAIESRLLKPAPK